MVEYTNLDVWADRQTVRVSSTAGEAQKPNDPPPITDRVEKTLTVIRQHGQPVTEEELRSLGTHLFRSLFSGQTLSVFRRTLERARNRRDGVRIRLRFAVPELEQVPWELLFDPDEGSFLAISSWTPVVRYRPAPEPPARLSVAGPVRLLYVTATPVGFPPLSEANEERVIREGLGQLIDRGVLQMDWLRHASRERLLERLHGTYDIFHFAGHGGRDKPSGKGLVVLEDDAGQSQQVDSEQLSVMLADNDIRLAVLNTNESLYSANALTKAGIAAVVSWGSRVADRDAADFSRVFYSALADGFAVDQAVTEARKALFLSAQSPAWGFLHLATLLPDGILFEQSEERAARRVRGEVIYSAGGMVAQKYNPVSGEQLRTGGDFVGRDKVIASDLGSPIENPPTSEESALDEAVAPPDETVRVDLGRVQVHLERLEKVIATDPELSPYQRIQGMAYIEAYRDALGGRSSDLKLMENLRIQISQLGSGPARAAESLWQELKGG